jgi:hypothetical protein
MAIHFDTLEEIDLGYRQLTDMAIGEENVHPKKLNRGSLPNLKSFKGHINVFLQMIEAGMGCLNSLDKIEINLGAGRGWDATDNINIAMMFEELYALRYVVFTALSSSI